MATTTYQAPEVFELGAAEALTLGGKGCTVDGQDCEYFPDRERPTY